MERIVVSLKTAKALKAAGFPQKTEFYWVVTMTTNPHLSWYSGELPEAVDGRAWSAPSAQEIMEELISDRRSSNLIFRPFDEEYKSWMLEAEGRHSTYYVEDDDNIAELLAGAWLVLRKRI